MVLASQNLLSLLVRGWSLHSLLVRDSEWSHQLALVLERNEVSTFMDYIQCHIHSLLVWAVNEELLSARVWHSW